jgi:SulP family sulfate permease
MTGPETGTLGAVLLLRRLRQISGEDLRADALAGLTVTFVLIPQALAYAMLSGVSPVVGLYCASIPTLLYAFLGGSRYMAMGPVALTSLLIASGLAGHGTPGTPEYDLLAMTLATEVGLILLVLALLRAGFLVNFLSHPTILGFNAGAALLTGGSQLAGFFGIARSAVPEASPTNPWPFLLHLSEAHGPTVLESVGALVLLVLLRRHKPNWPGMLMVCIAGTVIGAGLNFESHGGAVVGDIPGGFPPLRMPAYDLELMTELFPTALSIAIVAYASSITVVKALAAQEGERLNPNLELWAFGACNLAAAAVGGFPVSSGLARATVVHQAGAKTQLNGLFTALGIMITLLVAAPLFRTLPKPVLAAIIVLAASRIIDVKGLRQTFSTKRNDGLTALFAFIATMVIGPELGLFVGIAVALVFFVSRTTTPHTAELGRIPGSMIYRNINRYSVEACPQVGILRIDAPLYYANARFLEDRIDAMFADRPEMKLLALDFAAVNDLDATAVLSLGRVVERLRERERDLHIVAAIGPVRDLLERSGLGEEIGEANLHRTILEAAPKLLTLVSRSYCEERCNKAAFPECTTIPRRGSGAVASTPPAGSSDSPLRDAPAED